MAEQRRRATARRPAGGRRTSARRRSRRPVGWPAPLLAVAAGVVALGPLVTPALLEVTASTAPVHAGPAVVPAPTAPQGVTGRDDVPAARAAVAPEPGLAVPQPPRPGRITIVPNAARGTQPAYTPRPDPCGGMTTPRRIVPGVVPGPGSASLDWMPDDRPEVVGYRVQAVSQQLVGGEQPAPVVQTVAQVTGCAPVTATITGLTAGTPYVFWLEEQVTSASTGVTRTVQVGATGAVVIG